MTTTRQSTRIPMMLVPGEEDGRHLRLVRVRTTTPLRLLADEIAARGGRVVQTLVPDHVIALLSERAELTHGVIDRDERRERADSPSTEAARAAFDKMRRPGRDSPDDGKSWDSPGKTPPWFRDPPSRAESIASETEASRYLVGRVAVAVVTVSRSRGTSPTAPAEFLTTAERTLAVAEATAGLGFLALAEPRARLNFIIQHFDVEIGVAPDPAAPNTFEGREAVWRDPALISLGYQAGTAGYRSLIRDMCERHQARWGTVIFVTRYPVFHFAYADSDRIVMDYANDGWGPNQLDRVIAHEMGHVFGALDEYAISKCKCTDLGGEFAVPNGNCITCAPTFTPCLMEANTFALCDFSRGQLGWREPAFPFDSDLVGFGDGGVLVSWNDGQGQFGPAQTVLGDLGFDAGWRVDKHLRMLADVTGDGRADLVGFGDDGVLIALNNGAGGFQPANQVLNDFAYVAGGWRVEKHPRFLADLTGDGRADIIGFGYAGVIVALNKGDGTFHPPVLAIADFGVNQGWKTDRHPRFLVDLTGDGRADIIGFGDAGVIVALNKGDGTFHPPVLAIADFGVNQGWKTDRHPRFLVDLTGDGRADIVGFGEHAVMVALNKGDGTFAPVRPVIANLCYGAGGWRVEKHPRFVADVTGDGRADIIGFGDAGVYVALNRGNGSFDAPKLVLADFGFSAGGWRVDMHPRFVTDLNSDGRADIVGFGQHGVIVAMSAGKGEFNPPQVVLSDLAFDAGGWRVDRHVRVLAKLK